MSRKKCSGLVSKSRTRTAHFQREPFDSISLRTRVNTSSSLTFLGCWTDYELPGPKLQLLILMCIVRGVARWRGTASVLSTGIPFRVRLAVGRVGREVRLRVTISAHFPVFASGGIDGTDPSYRAWSETVSLSAFLG
jgi:hypothetical protein